ncbi:MAG: hypothetical protein Q7V01_01115 [Vicinamibacterales bacterium]|nr:hypothetical protein [Vicinamibacterales bacterium]
MPLSQVTTGNRARILVRSSLADARRTVWALRSKALETHDLGGALDLVARQLRTA